jgi:hypothetical protein
VHFLGDTPVELSSDDPEIIAKVNILKRKYMTGPKLFIKKVIELLAGDEEEESFMRTFMMVFLATIVCPSTSDTIEWKYLYLLIDLQTMKSADWASFCLDLILAEVEKFQHKLSSLPDPMAVKPFHVGGCLPLLAVSLLYCKLIFSF